MYVFVFVCVYYGSACRFGQTHCQTNARQVDCMSRGKSFTFVIGEGESGKGGEAGSQAVSQAKSQTAAAAYTLCSRCCCSFSCCQGAKRQHPHARLMRSWSRSPAAFEGLGRGEVQWQPVPSSNIIAVINLTQCTHAHTHTHAT